MSHPLQPWLQSGSPLMVRHGERDAKGRPQRYRLRKLGIAGLPSDEIPGELASIGATEVKDHRNMLMLGERGSGITDLLRWWRDQLTMAGEPMLEISVASPVARWSGAPPAFADDVKSALARSLQDLIRVIREPEGTELDALYSFLTALDARSELPLTIAIERIGELGNQMRRLGEHLRVLAETSGENLRWLFFSQADGALGDIILSSGLRHLCDEWRMASFDREDILCLARSVVFGQPPAADPVEPFGASRTPADLTFADAVLDHTGGQPVLVQTLLAHIARSIDPSSTAPSLSIVDAAARALYASPPPVHQYWQRELEEILRRDQQALRGLGRRDLLRRLRAYSNGDRVARERIPSYERPLYIAGWLDLDRHDTWGFRSRFHREFAQAVIERFNTGVLR